MAELTDAQLDRYARHIVLRELGGGGQARLLAARVVIIGAGGIGSPAIQYLAAAGVGHLTIIDDDRVDRSNLQRQTLFSDADLGVEKASRAADAAMRLNADVAARGVVARIDGGNAATLLAGADVVLDGCDNFTTRLAVADAALAARIPLVSAAVTQFEGQLATYRGWEPALPCYRCVVGADPDRPGTSCSEVGVLGAMAGVIGSMAALEVIRSIAPFGDDLAGRLVIADALAMRFRTLTVRKDPGCPACGR
ncbi:HesA/MoeB/ThiF family protein [Sphingomonas sp.]|uniref:HesA/MoeB/ThiF family protein n=1 Tax=Sphingomonas sp. TaxID=28214 RepID=UPI002C021B25|nr:HesA/MoeB/ThiF family protein [Sphingomonas sp.]HTG37336.1 HesA/MoeB/ThiF family protein [Sphingomonas sp.]